MKGHSSASRTRPAARGVRRAVHGATALAVIAAAAGGALAYTTVGHKWATSQVFYYVNPVNLDLPQADVVAAVRKGADAWTQQTTAGIVLTYAGSTTGASLINNGKNEVFFRNATNGSLLASTYYWWDGTGKLVDADIVFYDAAYTFFTGTSGCSSGIYVEDGATHEFGHVLGLNHSSSSSATMYPSTSKCSQNWRTLDSDDIAGVTALYPPVGAPPASPTGLTVTGTTSSSVSLGWSDNSGNESNFLVERSPDGVSGWYQAASTLANTRTYTNTGLSSGSSYYYRVRASNAAGFSDYTNVVNARTSSAPSAPSAPSPASGATGVSRSPQLTWSSSNATSYDVYLGLKGAVTFKATVTSPAYQASGLSASKKHYWRIVARNASGSTQGATWTFTTGTK